LNFLLIVFIVLHLSESVRVSALCLLLPVITRILFLSGAFSYIQALGKDLPQSFINSILQKTACSVFGPKDQKQSLHCTSPSTIPLRCVNILVVSAFVDRGGLEALSSVGEECIKRLIEIRAEIEEGKGGLNDPWVALQSEVCLI
jgi:hypothetical protein